MVRRFGNTKWSMVCLGHFVLLLWLALALAVSVNFAAAQSDGGASDQASDVQLQIAERARESVSILQPLIELEQSLEAQITAASATTTADDDAAATELERLRGELNAVQLQISDVISGVSEADYQQAEGTSFDLNNEVQDLVEPFVLVLNEATSDARQLERARRDLDRAQTRFEDASVAIENVEALLGEVQTPALVERLTQSQTVWQERRDLHATQIEALTRRIDDLRAERVPVGRNVNSAFEEFFRERGTSLALGFGAFIGVIIIGRLLQALLSRLFALKRGERTFAMRLGQLVVMVLTVLAAFGAMLAVFNMRNDWLLLALALLAFLAALWVAIKMLPQLIEQVSVLLNLGAVQENERVLFNGVPFKVQRLNVFTDLVNPALDGGEFTLPVRELLGMHSRPAAHDEAWFPSNKGDWVRLSDGNAGQVVAQTPEMVVVEMLGGARVTYQTADYLAATPENLSQGYRAEVEFGISYRHQKDATTRILDQMRDGVRAHFEALLGADEVVGVDVELLRAGASSIDYEVEVDVAGSSAHRFETVERELARCMIDLANRYDWEIPFQQIVLHKAADTS